jgi:hypothetical protein
MDSNFQMAFVGELIVEQNSNVLETVLDCSFDSYHLSPLIFSATVLVCKNDKFSHTHTWTQILKWPFLVVSELIVEQNSNVLATVGQ